MKSSERWADLRIMIPGKISPAFIRRRLLAANIENNSIPEEVFNYDNGLPSGKRSHFRFGGGQYFHIYAVGDKACEILTNSVQPIKRTLDGIYSKDISVELRSNKYLVEIHPTPVTYKIPGLALIQQPDNYELVSQLPSHKLARYVKGLIRNHLEREICIVDVPGISFENPVDITLPTIKSIETISIKPGKRFLIAKEVHFSCNLYIRGIIHAGYLLSHGYGKIRLEACR